VDAEPAEKDGEDARRLLVAGPDANEPRAVPVVLDHGQDRPPAHAPVDLRDADYGLQEAVYALALLRQGHERVEVHFAFLDAPAVVSSVYGAADGEALAARVAGTVRAALDGPYVPRPGDACNGCPALDLYCAGPALDAIHAAPDA